MPTASSSYLNRSAQQKAHVWHGSTCSACLRCSGRHCLTWLQVSTTSFSVDRHPVPLELAVVLQLLLRQLKLLLLPLLRLLLLPQLRPLLLRHLLLRRLPPQLFLRAHPNLKPLHRSVEHLPWLLNLFRHSPRLHLKQQYLRQVQKRQRMQQQQL